MSAPVLGPSERAAWEAIKQWAASAFCLDSETPEDAARNVTATINALLAAEPEAETVKEWGERMESQFGLGEVVSIAHEARRYGSRPVVTITMDEWPTPPRELLGIGRRVRVTVPAAEGPEAGVASLREFDERYLPQLAGKNELTEPPAAPAPDAELSHASPGPELDGLLHEYYEMGLEEGREGRGWRASERYARDRERTKVANRIREHVERREAAARVTGLEDAIRICERRAVVLGLPRDENEALKCAIEIGVLKASALTRRAEP